MNQIKTCAASLLLLATAIDSIDALAQSQLTAPAPSAALTTVDTPVWKRITLGSHKGVNALRTALDEAKVRVGDSADEIIGRPAFEISRARRDVDLVAVTAAELGFGRATTLADIYRRAAELGLELCPAEVGPLLRLHYVNQPVGEFLNIAMHPIATYGGDLVALSVANAGTGRLLIGGDGRPDLMLSPQARFVFVRPQRIATP